MSHKKYNLTDMVSLVCVSLYLLIVSNLCVANDSIGLKRILHTERLLNAGYQGQDVRIGVISNGVYNYPALVRQNILPANIVVMTQGKGVDDEGDWMLQVVHQVAPKAKLAFCAGMSQQVVVACARKLLSRFHADIIVDDVNQQPVFYFPTLKQNVFSDLASQYPNVLFFTGAGNNNGGYYQSVWKPASLQLNGQKFVAQDFSDAAGSPPVPYDVFTIPPGAGARVLLGTNADPNGGPRECGPNNPVLSLVLMSRENTIIKQVEGSCPLLKLQYKNPSAFPQRIRVAVLLDKPPAAGLLKLKLVVTQLSHAVSPMLLKFHTPGSAGNSAASQQLNAVAAVDPNSGWHGHYLREQFANIGPQCQDFVQTGPNQWQKLAQERCYRQPEFVVPDRALVMMYRNAREQMMPFIGDSAAGPVAAGVSALLISAHVRPEKVVSLLENTATSQLDYRGWNSEYGYGLINADAASVAAGIFPPRNYRGLNAEIVSFRPDAIFRHYRKLSLMAFRGDRQALDTLRDAANSGNLDAETWLGLYKHESGDNARAAFWILRASRSGAAYAQSFLGTLYNRGWGVPVDPRAAQAWWHRAVRAGVAVAMFNMGVTRMQGRGVFPNPVTAAALMDAAQMRGLRNPRLARMRAIISSKMTLAQVRMANKIAGNYARDPLSIPLP